MVMRERITDARFDACLVPQQPASAVIAREGGRSSKHRCAQQFLGALLRRCLLDAPLSRGMTAEEVAKVGPFAEPKGNGSSYDERPVAQRIALRNSC